jgi:putative endonuclease
MAGAVAADVGWRLTVADATWFVYMILTDKDRLYTGIATDVQRRLQEHRDVAEGRVKARGAKYFRTQKPVRVVYMEAFAEASRRERCIKSLTAGQKRRLCAAQAGDATGRANPAVID